MTAEEAQAKAKHIRQARRLSLVSQHCASPFIQRDPSTEITFLKCKIENVKNIKDPTQKKIKKRSQRHRHTNG